MGIDTTIKMKYTKLYDIAAAMHWYINVMSLDSDEQITHTFRTAQNKCE